MADFVVVTGLSGAGRSETAKHLEDLGWFVIENLPPSLMPKVAELAATPTTRYHHVALIVGGGVDHDEVAEAIRNLRADPDNRVRQLFLHAREPVLVRRYDATRHRHPIHDEDGIASAIRAETAAMEPIRAMADLRIDTSDLNVHQLRERLVALFPIDAAGKAMTIRIVSFGFKHGVPIDVDMLLDCRFLPNPHWVDELRPLTGLEKPVSDYVLQQPLAQDFLRSLRGMLAVVMPAYAAEGKSYLAIALGCTGGHHRSVAIAEEVRDILAALGFEASVTHRDIDA